MSETDHPVSQVPEEGLNETLDEHKVCMKLVEAVEDCLAQPPDTGGKWVAMLIERLRPLRQGLADHFVSEEKGALFGTLPIARPRLARRLDVLKNEHPVILERLEKILADAEKLDDPEIFELREMNAAVQLFIATLRRHEAAENEIVMHSLWDEIGVGD